MEKIYREDWQRQYVKQRLTSNKFALTLYHLRIGNFYYNGDAADMVFNYWNPLSWVLAIVAIIATILIAGIPELYNYPEHAGLRVSPFFKKNNYEVEWIKLD